MAATSPTVATLRPGDAVEGMFACVRKDRLRTRNGSAYLLLELRDRTGSVAARAFRDADLLSGRFERGDLVRVRGRAERFRDELQLEVESIARAADGDADPADFLPVAYRDLDELDGFLETLCDEVRHPALRALLGGMLADTELRAAWRRAPCTRGGHHAYLGGLLEHTVAVSQLCLELGPLHPRLDSDLLLCAGLVHDIGKTREFSLGAEIASSDEGRLLGHLVLGQQIIDAHARGMPEAMRLALLHCVLCHHGPDSAPGRRFASAEALALYRVNSLEAAVKGALEHGLAALP